MTIPPYPGYDEAKGRTFLHKNKQGVYVYVTRPELIAAYAVSTPTPLKAPAA